MENTPMRVLVTGAAGQLGYALVGMIAQGRMLGPDQPIILHMFGLTAQSLNGLKMELLDCASPLLKDVVATTDIVEACKRVNVAIFIGGAPCKEGMGRNDMLPMNAVIYKSQASVLDQHASPNCKVLVVANPANTNALVLKEFAPSIPPKNITCLNRLDHNRAINQLAAKLNVHVSRVKNVIIWGNHSPTLYPDTDYATLSTSDGEIRVKELVDEKWLKTEFITLVQERGDLVLKTRKRNSALSAASAACDHIRNWLLGTPKGEWVSMGVCSDGSYDIPQGLIYSFPVICQDGEWSIVQGLNIDEFSRTKMDETADELLEEASMAYACVNPE